jgi:hypothetical protein
MYWVYAHFTADTDSVFYIGKGVTGRCSSKLSRSNFWKNIATKHGWYFVILFRGTEDQLRNIAKICELREVTKQKRE